MEESEGLAYNDPHSNSDATVMGVVAHEGLNYLCVMSLQIPCLTPHRVWPLTHQGHQWSTCHY